MGEGEEGKKSVKKAGYLPSLGEGESLTEGGWGVGETGGSLIKREKGETMFGIEREQTIICID